MSKEVIFEALAFLDGYKPSPSMSGMSDFNQIHEIYIQNAVISLISIKEHNPQTDVGIVINFELSKKWKRMLESKDIIIWEKSFDEFHMPQEIVYSLSYYKLCAFNYLLNISSYEKYCFIDCDTFAVRDFSPVWQECNNSFLIVPGDEGMDHKVRKEIADLYKDLHNTTKNVTHYCSSFIIAERADAVKVFNKAFDIYREITRLQLKPAGGDEIIWSLALEDLNIRIYSPKVYCLLSNNGFTNYRIDKADYQDSNIVMWHLPTEKRYALIWAYKYYEKNNVLPSMKQMASAARIRQVRCHYTWKSIVSLFQDKTVFRRNVKKLLRK